MQKPKASQRELIAGHHEFPVLRSDNIPVVGPIYQSVKFTFPSLQDLENAVAGKSHGYWYQRNNNPTLRELEETLAGIQSQDDAIVTSSGISAILLPMLSLLESGDHVMFFLESYIASRILAPMLLNKFGIQSSFISMHNLKVVEEVAQREKTKLILIEGITHPMNRIPDLEGIVRIAKSVGAYTVLDNTCAGIHQMTEIPADLFVHSLTKFANGHGDVMAGAVLGSKALIKKIRLHHGLIGATLDPHSAFLILRGLKSYFVRFKAQNETAGRLAQWLETHPSISKVWYPGLRSHPEHQLAKKQLEQFGALITFDLNENVDLRKFIDSLELFHLTFSLGATESMALPVKMFYASDLSPENQKQLEISDKTTRLSIGLEPFEALKDDLLNALTRASAP